MIDFTNYSDDELKDISLVGVSDELKKRGYKLGWYKNTDYVGAIYIMVNPAFPNLVKIGYADDVQKRLKTFNNNSGLPDPFHCYAIYKVKKRLEDLKLHNLIDTLDSSLRHSKNREFYEMDCDKAYEILNAIAQINGSEDQLILNPFADSYISGLCKEEIDKNSQHSKASKLTFEMIHIPIGSALIYVKDINIKCVTVDLINKVEYNGKIYSISKLAKKLLNISAAQGGKYFTYNGEVLTDIRNRLGV